MIEVNITKKEILTQKEKCYISGTAKCLPTATYSCKRMFNKNNVLCPINFQNFKMISWFFDDLNARFSFQGFLSRKNHGPLYSFPAVQ